MCSSIPVSGPLLFLTIAVMHLPLSSSHSVSKPEGPVPRWIDPCKARPFTLLEPVRDFAGLSVTDEQEQEVFDAVIAATRMAHTYAERVKSKFVSQFCVSNYAPLAPADCVKRQKSMTRR